mmetsp:Transcript_7932/g.23486  ORF Transcript_7932/g.23486 Transcript_7932/m.23486 type:complete len:264 (+) Transcript_7932:1736-2527(+)
MKCTSEEVAMLLLFISLFLFCKKVVNNRVEEDATNTNATTKKLDRVEGLSQNDRNTNNNNHTLRRIGNTLCHSTSLFQGHGCKLIVSIEPEARSNEIGRDGWVGLPQINELSKLRSFLRQHERYTHQEAKNGSKGELVANRSHALFQAFSFHQLLAFISLYRSEHVGNAGRYKSRPSKIELFNRRKNDTSDNNREAQPLGLRDLLAIDKLGHDSCKSRFSRFHNLSKGHSSRRESKHRRRMSTHEAEGHRKHLDDIIESHRGG